MKHRKDYTDDFLAFWRVYPPQLSGRVWHKPGKRLAFEVWLEMSESQKSHAMYSIGKYAQTVKDGKFVAHARTWLNQCRYEDWDMPDIGERLPDELTTKMKMVEKLSEDDRNRKLNAERNRQMKLMAANND